MDGKVERKNGRIYWILLLIYADRKGTTLVTFLYPTISTYVLLKLAFYPYKVLLQDIYIQNIEYACC